MCWASSPFHALAPGPWDSEMPNLQLQGHLQHSVCLGHPLTKCLLKFPIVLQFKTTILPVAQEDPVYLSSLAAHFFCFIWLHSPHFSFLSPSPSDLRAYAHTDLSAWDSFSLLPTTAFPLLVTQIEFISVVKSENMDALISHASKIMLKILQARLQQYVN